MDFRVFSRNISENMHARCVREDTKQALKGNLQADGVQSCQTFFVRCCPSFMRLTRDEAFAIRYHMGFSGNEDKNSVGRALEMFPLALAVNVADMEATYYLEGSVK